MLFGAKKLKKAKRSKKSRRHRENKENCDLRSRVSKSKIQFDLFDEFARTETRPVSLNLKPEKKENQTGCGDFDLPKKLSPEKILNTISTNSITKKLKIPTDEYSHLNP